MRSADTRGHAAAEWSCRTALHVAAFEGYYEVVEVLLSHGATVDLLSDELGYTPLMHVAAQDNYSLSVVAALLRHGAEVDRKNSLGDTALHWASDAGNTELVRLLLESGADADCVGSAGVTPYSLASRHAATRKLIGNWTKRNGRSKGSARGHGQGEHHPQGHGLLWGVSWTWYKVGVEVGAGLLLVGLVLLPFFPRPAGTRLRGEARKEKKKAKCNR